MGECMGKCVGSGQMTNLIKLELIDIIQFCLKIYDLWRHPHLWVDGWVNGWAHVKSLKSNKPWPNWDNSIMDILDIFWTFYLKHFSYFFVQPTSALHHSLLCGGMVNQWLFSVIRNSSLYHQIFKGVLSSSQQNPRAFSVPSTIELTDNTMIESLSRTENEVNTSRRDSHEQLVVNYEVH